MFAIAAPSVLIAWEDGLTRGYDEVVEPSCRRRVAVVVLRGGHDEAVVPPLKEQRRRIMMMPHATPQKQKGVEKHNNDNNNNASRGAAISLTPRVSSRVRSARTRSRPPTTTTDAAR